MNKFRNSLILILLSLFSICQAENYRLLTIYKSDNIKIGKDSYKSGQVFSDAEKIEWTENATAIKTQRLSDKKIVVISQKQFANTLSSSLSDYMKQVHHLSTRNSSDAESIKEQLDGVLPCGKGITIDLSIEPNKDRWFAVRWKNEQGEINTVKLSLKKNGTQIIVPAKNIWGKSPDKESIVAELIMGYGAFMVDEEIVDSNIEIIPL